MNRRGWIRIVEALVAIMIIATAILLITPRNQNPDFEKEIHTKQRAILEVIAQNDTYRNEIVTINSARTGPCTIVPSGGPHTFMDFIQKNLPSTWDFAITVCDLVSFNNNVLPPNCVSNLYVSETIISIPPSRRLTSTQTKVQLYGWLKDSCN